MTLKETKVKLEKIEAIILADHSEIIEMKGDITATNARQDNHTKRESEAQGRTDKALEALSLQLSHGFRDMKDEISVIVAKVNKHQPTIDLAVEREARNKMLLNNALKYGTVLTVGGLISLVYQHFTV